MSDCRQTENPKGYLKRTTPIGDIVQIAATPSKDFCEENTVFALTSTGRVFYYEIPRRGTSGASTWRWTELPPIESPWRIAEE